MSEIEQQQKLESVNETLVVIVPDFKEMSCTAAGELGRYLAEVLKGAVRL